MRPMAYGSTALSVLEKNNSYWFSVLPVQSF